MGYLISVLCALLNSAKDLVSKRLSFSLDATASTYASFAYALPGYAILLAMRTYLGVETYHFSRYFFELVLLRSLSDSGAEWMKMKALSFGEISLVAPFISLAPIFMLALSPLITGDVPSRLGVVAVVSTVAGSLVLLPRGRQIFDPRLRAALAYSLGTSICFALNICFDRLAVQTASAPLSGCMMTLACAVYFAPSVLRRKERRAELRVHRGPLFLRGALETAFMTTKLWALQFLQAPYVAALQRVSLLLSIAGGHLMFREKDFARRIAAGALITAGAMLVLLA
jgi:drug/metabolite transporter (DMT)-like permease